MAFCIFDMPVAPVAYRVSEDGVPTQLGRKYERLVEANRTAFASLPPEDDPQFIRQSARLEETPLGCAIAEAVADIIGATPGEPVPQVGGERDDTLLSLLFRGIVLLDPDVSALARSCACVLRLRAEV
jgi:hypothetical protein